MYNNSHLPLNEKTKRELDNWLKRKYLGEKNGSGGLS